jgi:hypothetical protein
MVSMVSRRRAALASTPLAGGPLAGRPLAGAVHRALSSPQASSLSRGLVMHVALWGALVMLLATIGLLILSRKPKAVAAPKPAPEPKPASARAPAPEPKPKPEPIVDPVVEPKLEPVVEPTLEPAMELRPAQRHQVALGDDWIEVVLAETPGQPSCPGAPPYLTWAPLPYDVPDDGLAFACIGAGDDGCLFVDLAASPGPVSITGDTDAAIRLAESIVYQLCSRASVGQAISVTLVGSAIPRPYPANAIAIPTLDDLEPVGPSLSPGGTELVLCQLNSGQDASVLARYAESSPDRVIPVVLGYLPGAAWSFTALPGTDLDEGLSLSSLAQA